MCKKLQEITNLSSFGIVLVVLGHSYATLNLKGGFFLDFLYSVREIVYLFHMPLFMFISGYLFMHANPASGRIEYAGFIRKKVIRLLWPYLAISSLAYPVKAILSQFAWNPVSFGINGYFRTLVFPHENTIFFFWFLPTLFIIFFFAPGMRRALFSPQRGFFCALISGVLIMLNLLNPAVGIKVLALESVVKFMFFFWFGCCFYQFRSRLIPSGAYRNILAVIMFAVVVLIHLKGADGNGARLVAAVFGILASCYFVNWYSEKEWNLFGYINGYSYQIYLLSWFPQVFFRILTSQTFELSFYVSYGCMFVGGLLLPVIVARGFARYMPQVKSIFGM